MFIDTNVLIDPEAHADWFFTKSDIFAPVICDFIEGEVLNLKRQPILDALKKDPSHQGFYFETSYNSREGSKQSLKDMPTSGMAEAVLVEYDKKLDPSGMSNDTKEAKRASLSKSKFVDFSLLTVATICAFRRKKQAVIVTRDRWIKLSCRSLEEQFRLPIYCYDQWSFSVQEIALRARAN